MELEPSELVNDKMLEKQQQQQEEDEEHFHVLAVDDSLIDRKLLERLLKISSYKVTFVDSADKALKYLGLLDDFETASPMSSDSSSSSSSPPSSQLQEGLKVNLIMTDYCMPGISGYDLLKRVKGSSWKDVPVVIMSSENVPSRITMCLEEGAEEFLLKPLQLSDLEKLQQYLMKSLNSPNSSSDDQQQPDGSIATSDNDDSNNINSNIIISKRKAVLTESSERSRPKPKGLAVV